MVQSLVVVPCGQAKIWKTWPDAGPTLARDAYTGGPFKLHRQYAERFAGRWVVLSAKHGFIPPDFVIPGPYNVTFKKKNPAPVDVETLRKQVDRQSLNVCDPIIVLGGKEYQQAARAAFEPWQVRLLSPFAGLPIGKEMRAVKLAIAAGDALHRDS